MGRGCRLRATALLSVPAPLLGNRWRIRRGNEAVTDTKRRTDECKKLQTLPGPSCPLRFNWHLRPPDQKGGCNRLLEAWPLGCRADAVHRMLGRVEAQRRRGRLRRAANGGSMRATPKSLVVDATPAHCPCSFVLRTQSPTCGALVFVASVAAGPYDTLATATLLAAAPELADALDPDTLEAIAAEIDCHTHSARAHSLRVIATKQRAALSKAGCL